MTSIPVWPVFSQKTLNESKTDTLEAFNGNHFLIDEMYDTSLNSGSSGHQSYQCTVCKKVFLSKEDLFNHKKMSLTCSPKFECDICMKMLNSTKAVRKHKTTHHRTDNKKYSCVVCNKTFLLPFKLNAHQNKSHVAYENIECKVCGFSFLGPERIKSHTRKAHLNKRHACPFDCSVCGKVFYLKNALIRHEQTHGKAVEMVVCEICGKSYKGAQSLYYHIRYCHQKLKAVPKCLKCNMIFKHYDSLRTHLHDVHKEKVLVTAVCEICGKTLKNKEQLKSHLLIHSSERRFKCNICNATFKQKVTLSTHSRVHTSICKYNCNDCGKSFRWKQTFVKHVNKCKAPLPLNG